MQPNSNDSKDLQPPQENADTDSGTEIIVSSETKKAFLNEPNQPLGQLTFNPEINISEEEEESEDGMFRAIRPKLKILGILGLLLLSVFVFFSFVVKTYVVDGNSMYPTFSDEDHVVLWVTGKTFSSLTFRDYVPKRGEVIVLSNDQEKDDYIKRVVALPNEHVILRDGKFTVYNNENPNGFDPDSSFSEKLRSTDGELDLYVPDNHVFVVGDNREPEGSLDSRNGLGTFPVDKIKGNVILRFLPIYDFTFFF